MQKWGRFRTFSFTVKPIFTPFELTSNQLLANLLRNDWGGGGGLQMAPLK